MGMQPLRFLAQSLARLASPEHCVFAAADLRALFPELSDEAFRAVLSRATSAGVLTRVCRGLYVYTPALPNDGRALYRFAARLRADAFNYISLETVLSDAGAISQVPINTLFVMSSGRSSRIACDRWGVIEFVHTKQRPAEIANDLHYDTECGMWRASVSLALRDTRATRRSLDLVDWSVVDELV